MARTETDIFETEAADFTRLKLVVAILMGAYFLWATAHPADWRPIDGVNLVMHEAGHVVFRPFGEFLMIAGGSLFQVIVPAVFASYFLFNKNNYASALILFWAGESVLNVSVYAADSVEMQLPLLGGNDSIHDWNYMLDQLGLLWQTGKIAFAIRALGTLAILFALFWAIYSARRSRRQPVPSGILT